MSFLSLLSFTDGYCFTLMLVQKCIIFRDSWKGLSQSQVSDNFQIISLSTASIPNSHVEADGSINLLTKHQLETEGIIWDCMVCWRCLQCFTWRFVWNGAGSFVLHFSIFKESFSQTIYNIRTFLIPQEEIKIQDRKN